MNCAASNTQDQPLLESTRMLDYLFNTYYQDNKGYSNQTSSHWKKFGEFQRVIKTDGSYSIKGAGFGDYRENSGILASILNIPTRLYLRNMLCTCDKEIVQKTMNIAKSTNRVFSYDMGRMALTVQLLSQKLGDLNKKSIVIIGDGYGTLGSILKSLFPNANITYINLGRTLLFDAFYTQMSFPSLSHNLITLLEKKRGDFNYIEAESVFGMQVDGDIFINIASMQEMNIDTIHSYMNIIRSQNKETSFYCCNRISKDLPDGTNIKFSDYGWDDRDELIIDELCPWYQKAPKNRPPFVYHFDGPIQHRLIKIKPTRPPI